jgi:hypothetical protein
LYGSAERVSDPQMHRYAEAICEAVTAIAVVDDVLTAGVHYRAMHTVLSRRFPDVPIIGVFVARRVFPDPAEDF